MANESAANIYFINMRAAGKKNSNTGGVYTPAYKNSNGKDVPAKWRGNVFINNPSYINATGERVEGDSITITVIAWNGKNVQAGKGLADMMAKSISKGKEFSCPMQMHQYNKKKYINNTLISHNGEPVTNLTTEYRIDGHVLFGADSTAIIESEEMVWINSKIPEHDQFNMRPPNCHRPNSTDREAWLKIVENRKNTTYTGGAVYGYASVRLHDGTIPTTTRTNTPTEQMSGPPSNEPKSPEGFTYQQYLNSGKGWTRESLLQVYPNIVPAEPSGPSGPPPNITGMSPTEGAETMTQGSSIPL